MACAVKTCPGVLLNQEHELGDNECGYLNDKGTPLLKSKNDPYSCRRPYCSHTSFTQKARDKHEADPSKHRPDVMDFICDWTGHAEAVRTAGFCAVCQ